MNADFAKALKAMPLIAILRGLQPERAAAVALDLVEAGFSVIEVPLNGEGALEAIALIRRAVAKDVVIGAGTVVQAAQVHQARHAGAEFLVMPNLDRAVMLEGRALGLTLMPGVMTPSEAFSALALGADGLKLFPADAIGPVGLKALRSVLPKGQALVFPVSGITTDVMEAWHVAGADGLGIGSSLFKPGYSNQEIGDRARAFVAEWLRIEGSK